MPSIFTVSSKRMYDKCPKQYEYRYIKGLDAKELPKVLQRGIQFHEEAESTYSGLITEKGYNQWVRLGDEDLVPICAELPLEMPLSNFGQYSGDGSFAGVLDLLAQQTKDNTLWVVDHKSNIRFYPYPKLLSTEQLFLYYLALRKFRSDLDITGVCLSRVKVLHDVKYPHFRNYITRTLKESFGKELNMSLLKRLLTKRPGRGTISTVSNVKDVYVSKSITRRVTIQLRDKERKGLTKVLGIVIRNSSGYVTTSIRLFGSSLVHVEREYTIPSPEELDSVARDFLSYVQNLHQTSHFRRSPGLHCATCPYQKVCTLSRMTVEAPGSPVEAILALDPTLALIPPFQEVLRAKQREEDRERFARELQEGLADS